MDIVADSSTHGKVSISEVALRIGIPYTAVSVALRRTLLCYPYKIQCHHKLLPSNFMKRRAFVAWVVQKMAENDDWLSNVMRIDETPFKL